VFSRHFAPYYIRRTVHSPKLEATPALQERLGIPEVMAHFFIGEPVDSPFAALRNTMVHLQRGTLSLDSPRRLAAALFGAARMAFALKIKGRRATSNGANVTLNIETEQRPCADSRIRISDTPNVIGIPQTIVDWKVSDQDGEALRRYAAVVEGYLAALGMSDLEWRPKPADDARTWIGAGSDILHAMGGTRMGRSPDDSVVDQNLRVHGVDNLYVASCSTFPTGGSSNPTFTLMALCCRLANHLKEQHRPVVLATRSSH
jgi:choline dehydrogenase-like flavoprotein